MSLSEDQIHFLNQNRGTEPCVSVSATLKDNPNPDKECNCGECACKGRRNNIVEAESKPLIIEEVCIRQD